MPSKLSGIGTSIFTEMTQLAIQHDAINLGQGFPDYMPDPELIRCVHEAMLGGHNQYAPMAGLMALRSQVADSILARHGHRYEPEQELTITSGASEGLYAAITALVHTGDEVLIIDPAYDLYAPVTQMAGGRSRRVPMRPPSAGTPMFQMDWNRVEAEINDCTRLLVLNFPNNPTGILLTEADLDALEAIMSRHAQLLILSDEAYEYIVFDGQQHLSVVSRPALAAQTILVSSFGKSYHTTGWKTGYVCAPAPVSELIRKVHQYIVFSVPTPIQVGYSEYLRSHAQPERLAGFYQQKRDRLREGLAGSAFVPLQSQGSFFLLVDTSALPDMPEAALARQLTIDHGVGSIPVSAFYERPDDPASNHRVLRLCFAKKDVTLDAAIERLRAVAPQ